MFSAKKTISTVVIALSLTAATTVSANARGATFPDDDVNPPKSGVIIEDVMDVRQDRDGGRTNDIDVFNTGRASKSGKGADVNND